MKDLKAAIRAKMIESERERHNVTAIAIPTDSTDPHMSVDMQMMTQGGEVRIFGKPLVFDDQLAPNAFRIEGLTERVTYLMLGESAVYEVCRENTSRTKQQEKFDQQVREHAQKIGYEFALAFLQNKAKVAMTTLSAKIIYRLQVQLQAEVEARRELPPEHPIHGTLPGATEYAASELDKHRKAPFSGDKLDKADGSLSIQSTNIQSNAVRGGLTMEQFDRVRQSNPNVLGEWGGSSDHNPPMVNRVDYSKVRVREEDLGKAAERMIIEEAGTMWERMKGRLGL